jgi:isochorismate synthase
LIKNNELADILKFRFPGKHIQEKFGKLERIESQENTFGFVITDFEAKQWYVFREIKGLFNVDLHKGEANLMTSVDFDQYLSQFGSLMAKMQVGSLQKCVLSRVKMVQLQNFNTVDFFGNLCNAYPSAFVYLLSSEKLGTWVGATPEVFLKVEGNKGYTMSLAATKKKEDKSSWDDKELEEQRIVTEYLKNEIENIASQVELTEPIPYQAGPIKHLMTKLSFQIEPSGIRDFVKKIHPTPAVCGFPKKDALLEILNTEVHERQLYSGIIGWIGENESDLFVNLRCARIIDKTMYMFLGGGITYQSDANEEWQETENKSRTLLDQIEFNQLN